MNTRIESVTFRHPDYLAPPILHQASVDMRADNLGQSDSEMLLSINQWVPEFQHLTWALDQRYVGHSATWTLELSPEESQQVHDLLLSMFQKRRVVT